MRLLTKGALGFAALAVAAVVRRRASKPTAASARVVAEPRITWYVRVPASTPLEDPVALCGDTQQLGGWNPLGVLLRRVEPRLYRVTMHVPHGTSMNYKITRGRWSNVEKSHDGLERANRQLRVTRDEVVRLEVERWSDLP